ncbi:MAG TPA: THUMP domain-containing protein [Bacteroidales bacterium]|nr:THUMP domain-containing protein [Bacteroidales bacterium]
METNKNSFELVAKTFKGLEDVLATEITNLGAKDVKVLNRAVSFKADQMLLYKANLWLRTALKVLKPIHSFKARNEVELYKGIAQIDWSEYMNVDDTLSINTVVTSPYFNHSQFVALKAKDAIVDQFREKFNKRPSIDVENPTLLINIHLAEDECMVSLDSSGESLHRRGYRLNSVLAPLNEVLAAGMIMLTGWDGNSNFLDPMCGSGTIPIEAALIAYNIPPGIFRKEFGFEKWKDFDQELFQQVYDDDADSRTFDYQILGSDVSAGAIRIANENAKKAFLLNKIKLSVASMESVIPPEGGGIIITNPPYGERLKKNNIQAMYQSMGNHMKKYFAGYDVWILSGNKEAIDSIGLHPSKKINLLNGSIECKFQRYSIYSGSMKQKKVGSREK